MWRKGIEQLADGFPQGVAGSGGGFSEPCLEFGEDLLDQVEVWGIGRQVQDAGTDGPDCLPHRFG